jgi:hypothetical protein
VGLGPLNIDGRFVPFASFGEGQAEQLQRLHRWLDQSPFDATMRTRLASERHGVAHCANRIEGVDRHWRGERQERRRVSKVRRLIRWARRWRPAGSK